MNIFVPELKANQRTLIIWCVGILALVAVGIGKYAGLSASEQALNDLVAKMPKAIRGFMGGGEFNLSQASGYYGIIYSYLLLIAAIHAAMLGSNLLAKEERDKTAEFLLVKPVSRYQVVGAKLGAALCNILLLNVITWLISVLSMNALGNEEALTQEITLLMTGMFVIQCLFLSIGLVLSACLVNAKNASTWTTSIVLLTYLLAVGINMTDSLKGMTFLTPFKYIDTAGIINGGGLSIVYLIASILISLILFGISFVYYKKRDIQL